MNGSTPRSLLDYDALTTQPGLRTRDVADDAGRLPNFVHVGNNEHALEAYLRLHVRDWTESARRKLRSLG